MDKVTHYRQIIQQVIEHYAREMSHGNQVKILPIYDTQHDQYLLVSLVGVTNAANTQSSFTPSYEMTRFTLKMIAQKKASAMNYSRQVCRSLTSNGLG